MFSRLQLHEILVEALGSRNVYYQPPETVKMNYPCIVYQRSNANTIFADNGLYLNKTGYDVTVIDKNPDSNINEKIMNLPLCRFERHFTADNLNHDVYKIYY